MQWDKLKEDTPTKRNSGRAAVLSGVGERYDMNKFEAYPLEEYPEIAEASFPSEIEIAYAVCGKDCTKT